MFKVRAVYRGYPQAGGVLVIVPRDGTDKLIGTTDRNGEVTFSRNPGWCDVYFKDAKCYQGDLAKHGSFWNLFPF